MNNNEIIKEVKKVIRKLRPYLNQDGVVYIKLLGACMGCSSSDDTIKNSIEAMLLEEVPYVIGVEKVEDDQAWKQEILSLVR